MIRLTKLTDYGVVLMSHLATDPGRRMTASSLAMRTQISVPTVSKLLKRLAKQGLLISRRGANGGYGLAFDPADLSVADVIAALEGPIAMTECVEVSTSECSQEDVCQVRGNWQKINDVVRTALEGISLEEMAQPLTFPLQSMSENLVTLSAPRP